MQFIRKMIQYEKQKSRHEHNEFKVKVGKSGAFFFSVRNCFSTEFHQIQIMNEKKTVVFCGNAKSEGKKVLMNRKQSL